MLENNFQMLKGFPIYLAIYLLKQLSASIDIVKMSNYYTAHEVDMFCVKRMNVNWTEMC